MAILCYYHLIKVNEILDQNVKEFTFVLKQNIMKFSHLDGNDTPLAS